MNESPRTTPTHRAQLRQQWLQQAGAAFDLYFDGGQNPPPVTFSPREGRVCSLTRERAAWLLEQDRADDAAVRPEDSHPVPCPTCGRPARRHTPPGESLPRRQRCSAAGEVTLSRAPWHCKTCRVSFFPSGPQAGMGHGGLSPTLLRQAVRQASKAASFKDASKDLRELAGFAISAPPLQRLTERIGGEWHPQRDAAVQAFQEDRLARDYAKTPPAWRR